MEVRDKKALIGAGIGLGAVFLLARSTGAGGKACVHGTVRNSQTGADIAGATVLLTPGGLFTTDAQGEFKADGLEPGSFSAQVSAPGFTPATFTFEAKAGDRWVIFLLSPEPIIILGAHVKGVVTDSLTGQPVAGAQVNIGGVFYLGTDLAGNYQTGELPPGLYQSSFAAEGYITHHAAIALAVNQQVTFNVALEPNPAVAKPGLHGRVTNEGGTFGVAGAQVSVAGPVNMETATDTAGEYAFTGLEAGNYAMTVAAQGFYTWQSPVTLVNGVDSLISPRLQVKPNDPPPATNCTLSGFAREPEGTPVAGVSVKLVGAACNKVAVSFSDGRYSITGLSSGYYDIEAAKDGYLADSFPVTIFAGANVQDVVMVPAANPTGETPRCLNITYPTKVTAGIPFSVSARVTTPYVANFATYCNIGLFLRVKYGTSYRNVKIFDQGAYINSPDVTLKANVSIPHYNDGRLLVPGSYRLVGVIKTWLTKTVSVPGTRTYNCIMPDGTLMPAYPEVQFHPDEPMPDYCIQDPNGEEGRDFLCCPEGTLTEFTSDPETGEFWMNPRAYDWNGLPAGSSNPAYGSPVTVAMGTVPYSIINITSPTGGAFLQNDLLHLNFTTEGVASMRISIIRADTLTLLRSLYFQEEGLSGEYWRCSICGVDFWSEDTGQEHCSYAHGSSGCLIYYPPETFYNTNWTFGPEVTTLDIKLSGQESMGGYLGEGKAVLGACQIQITAKSAYDGPDTVVKSPAFTVSA